MEMRIFSHQDWLSDWCCSRLAMSAALMQASPIQMRRKPRTTNKKILPCLKTLEIHDPLWYSTYVLKFENKKCWSRRSLLTVIRRREATKLRKYRFCGFCGNKIV